MSVGESSSLLWLREIVQPQADPRSGNAAALGDFSPDGMQKYCYPEEFTASGDVYIWSVSDAHTKGRHLCTYYEIWFFGPAFGSGQKVVTGGSTKAKIWRGLRRIYDYYYGENLNKNDPAHFSI